MVFNMKYVTIGRRTSTHGTGHAMYVVIVPQTFVKLASGLMPNNNPLVCHCFNCGYSAPFTMYLRDFHAHAHESFRRSTIKDSAPIIFDLDRIFNRKGVSDDTLCHLFYVDKYPNRKQWLDTLVQKKIKLKKYNINRLIQLHGEKHVKE